ncbi:MAG: 23S rRNA (pseudouridine(1915)-N(3))-methyltransferase RlmH [Lachnospiraceae bacterium]|nr:23S rRNA (pseudouridine(1915)-N(3))-methyltransferase RlmH [Lachnospiraceae bacterium]
MKVSIISVGKIKEKYFVSAIEEYSKRLSRYCKLNLIEVADEKTVENASEATLDVIKAKEAERIIKNISDDMYVITLEIKGDMIDSVALSNKINDITVRGYSNICFIIGGSVGLHKSVSDRADYKLSFSKMTFPHQLMKVVLLEQIYRSFRILNNEPYHK